MIFDQRYYYNLDCSKAVPMESEEANSLIGVAGFVMDDARANDLGIGVIAPEPKTLDKAPADKQMKPESKEQPEEVAPQEDAKP